MADDHKARRFYRSMARMILESDAIKMASLPEQIYDEAMDCGMNARVVEGMRAADAAFRAIVTEDDIAGLVRKLSSDVAEGVAELRRPKEGRVVPLGDMVQTRDDRPGRTVLRSVPLTEKGFRFSADGRRAYVPVTFGFACYEGQTAMDSFKGLQAGLVETRSEAECWISGGLPVNLRQVVPDIIVDGI